MRWHALFLVMVRWVCDEQMKRYSADEKNKIIDIILSNKLTIKEFIENEKDAPAESTIRNWLKEYKSKGVFADDNKNDAIASWSGYSYQGKMAILCTIEKINELIDKGKWENWKLQLEKLQDFVFINDSEIDSLWQVKAKLSTKRYQSYEDAMKKLMEDKVASGVPSAKCYLITANEVNNWTEAGNVYQKDIVLYKYKEDFVSVTTVSTAIEEQLEILIKKIGVSVDKEAAYLLLCALIEDKVSEFHKAGKKDQYIITFEEMVARIKDTEKFEERISSLRQKENIYKNICEKIDEGSQIYCDEVCKKKESGKCKGNACSVNRNKELVNEADIGCYMRSIKPDREKDLDFIFSYPEDYADTICHSVHTAPAMALDLENDIVYLTCFEGRVRTIPTMLEMKPDKVERLSRTLEAIERNQWLKDNIGNKILTGKTESKVYGTKLSKFTEIELDDLLNNAAILDKKDENVEKYMLGMHEKEKATEISNSIIIVDREMIVKYFEEGIEIEDEE